MSPASRRQTPHWDGVLYDSAGGVGVVTLNRPERLNALDHGPGSLHRDLSDAVAYADADPDVGCIVVTGAGRAFSAGGAIRGELPRSGLEWHRFLLTQDEDNERLRSTTKPVIGAISGYCYGAGLILACNFDILLAAESARFGFIEMRFGDPAGEVLTYLVGPQWAKFLALSGEIISARKAKEIGLVLDVFPDDRMLAKAKDLARRIAAIPQPAVALQRRMVNAALDNMGWRSQKAVANALNALQAANRNEHRDREGRRFVDLQETDWAEFKRARDRPFEPPWLEPDPAGAAPGSDPGHPRSSRTRSDS